MNKSTLRERVSVTVRGYDILKEYCPGLASGKAASALITALQPFVSLWFSAQIINELTGQRRVNLLFFYVCIVLLCNLVISMLRSVLDRITSEKQAQMWDFSRKYSLTNNCLWTMWIWKMQKFCSSAKRRKKICLCLATVLGNWYGERKGWSVQPLILLFQFACQ